MSYRGKWRSRKDSNLHDLAATRFPSGATTIITLLQMATGVSVELTTPFRGVLVFGTRRNSHFPFPPDGDVRETRTPTSGHPG